MEAHDRNNADIPLDRIDSIIRDFPVRLAVLFGSYARKDASPQSDLDLAVEFEGIEVGDPGYNEQFLGLGAELEIELSMPVDLVDLHRINPTLGRRIHQEGIVIFGSPERLDELAETQFQETERPSPRERLDGAIERIEGHF